MTKDFKRKHFPGPFKNDYDQTPRLFRRLRKTKQITHAQFIVLSELAINCFAHFKLKQPLKYRKIAREAGTNPMYITRAVKELQHLNFIELQPEDKKIFYTLNWSMLWPSLSLDYKNKIRREIPKYATMFPETIKERAQKIRRERYFMQKAKGQKTKIVETPEDYKKNYTDHLENIKNQAKKE